MTTRPADTRRWLDMLAAERSTVTGKDITREDVAAMCLADWLKATKGRRS